jgi:hypothetical protein
MARQSALNARANEGAIHVVEALEFEGPKTRRMVDLIDRLGLTDGKVLVLTTEARPEVYLSGRNLRSVHVTRYAEASAYEILWSDALVVEQAAIGGHALKGKAAKTAGRATRAQRATEGTAKKKAVGRAASQKRATAKKSTGKTKSSAKKAKTTKKKG